MWFIVAYWRHTVHSPYRLAGRARRRYYRVFRSSGKREETGTGNVLAGAALYVLAPPSRARTKRRYAAFAPQKTNFLLQSAS